MTTAIRDIQDLFRILDEDAEHLARLRRQIVGEDLLNLPARFDSFVDEQSRFNDEQRRFNRQVTRDLSQLKGAHAYNETVRRGHIIARRMGLRKARTLTGDDLVDMIEIADTSDMDPRAIDSFVDADLVMEATDRDGETVYIAMEISYTANRNDTRPPPATSSYSHDSPASQRVPPSPAYATILKSPTLSTAGKYTGTG
jgi:hypothetical protein